MKNNHIEAVAKLLDVEPYSPFIVELEYLWVQAIQDPITFLMASCYVYVSKLLCFESILRKGNIENDTNN